HGRYPCASTRLAAYWSPSCRSTRGIAMLPELWSDLRYRARALLRRHTVEQELDAELRFHIERQAEVYERAGMPRDEAMRRAQLAFGGVERMKEASRDMRG